MRRKIEKQETPFWTKVVGLGTIGYLIYSILNSNSSEALKYFAVTIVLLIIVFWYLQEKIKEVKNK